MLVRCLKPFSTGTFAMEQYEIRDVDDTLAAKLISAGLVQEVGGGSGGGVLVVHMNTESGALDKTWSEIDAADVVVIVFEGLDGGMLREFVTMTEIVDGSYYVSAVYDNGSASYVAESADGYPVHQ